MDNTDAINNSTLINLEWWWKTSLMQQMWFWYLKITIGSIQIGKYPTLQKFVFYCIMSVYSEILNDWFQQNGMTEN